MHTLRIQVLTFMPSTQTTVARAMQKPHITKNSIRTPIGKPSQEKLTLPRSLWVLLVRWSLLCAPTTHSVELIRCRLQDPEVRHGPDIQHKRAFQTFPLINNKSQVPDHMLPPRQHLKGNTNHTVPMVPASRQLLLHPTPRLTLNLQLFLHALLPSCLTSMWTRLSSPITTIASIGREKGYMASKPQNSRYVGRRLISIIAMISPITTAMRQPIPQILRNRPEDHMAQRTGNLGMEISKPGKKMRIRLGRLQLLQQVGR